MKYPSDSWPQGKISATIIFNDGREVRSDWEYSRHSDGRLSFSTLEIANPGGESFRYLQFYFVADQTEPSPEGPPEDLILRTEVFEKDGIPVRIEHW